MATDDDIRPWPGDADRVVAWIRASLQPPVTDGEFAVEGLERLRIALDLHGDDIERLTVDASAVTLRVRRASAPPPAAEPASVTTATPPVLSRTRATARLIRLLADPVQIEGIPLTAEAQLENVPFDWLVYAAPTVTDQPDSRYGVEPTDSAEARGTLSASMRSADLAPLIRAITAPLWAEAGVSLRRLRIDVDQDGPEGVRASAEAAIRWKLLRASARARVRVTVAPDGVITVRDLRVGSRNPIIALALRAARSQVDELVGRVYDLNDDIAGGPRLHDVRIQAGRELRVSARLG